MKNLNINNYVFTRPLTNDNSGFSKWGIGRRGGKDYFVKEFLSPTYPANASAFDNGQIKRKLSECSKFEEEKRMLYFAINHASDGNLIWIRQFFRTGAKYYMVTEAVLDKTLSIGEIAALSYKERLTVCTCAAHALFMLHKQGIVHADIKPDNIMVTKGKTLRAQLIDFDCSFFEKACPKLGEELNGDLVYLSPEAFLHMAGVESKLSCQLDVFAFGLVLHQYLTGELPYFDMEAYEYAYEAVLDGCTLSPAEKAGSEKIRDILQGMLQKEPEKRIKMEDVFEGFREELLLTAGRSVSETESSKKNKTGMDAVDKLELVAADDTPKNEVEESGGKEKTSSVDPSSFFSAAGNL